MRNTGANEIAGYAKKAFETHELTVEQANGPVRMWHCGKPGTGIYSFRVVAAPGFISIYGDVGDGMLAAYDRDMVAWLGGAIRSPSYLFSKMIKSRKVFRADLARNLLKELVDEADEDNKEKAEKMVENILDNWNDDPPDEHGFEFFNAAYEAGVDSEYFDSVMDHCADDYWTLECLKKFVELLKKGKP
jgi:hypothetical protein